MNGNLLFKPLNESFGVFLCPWIRDSLPSNWIIYRLITKTIVNQQFYDFPLSGIAFAGCLKLFV